MKKSMKQFILAALLVGGVLCAQPRGGRAGGPAPMPGPGPARPLPPPVVGRPGPAPMPGPGPAVRPAPVPGPGPAVRPVPGPGPAVRPVPGPGPRPVPPPPHPVVRPVPPPPHPAPMRHLTFPHRHPTSRFSFVWFVPPVGGPVYELTAYQIYECRNCHKVHYSPVVPVAEPCGAVPGFNHTYQVLGTYGSLAFRCTTCGVTVNSATVPSNGYCGAGYHVWQQLLNY